MVWHDFDNGRKVEKLGPKLNAFIYNKKDESQISNF